MARYFKTPHFEFVHFIDGLNFHGSPFSAFVIYIGVYLFSSLSASEEFQCEAVKECGPIAYVGNSE
jgi:hypothetical protein